MNALLANPYTALGATIPAYPNSKQSLIPTEGSTREDVAKVVKTVKEYPPAPRYSSCSTPHQPNETTLSNNVFGKRLPLLGFRATIILYPVTTRVYLNS